MKIFLFHPNLYARKESCSTFNYMDSLLAQSKHMYVLLINLFYYFI